jgi:hypothetical protein
MHVLNIHHEQVVSGGLVRHLPWPKRIDVVLLSFLAMVIGLADRINISVAAPAKEWDKSDGAGFSGSSSPFTRMVP